MMNRLVKKNLYVSYIFRNIYYKNKMVLFKMRKRLILYSKILILTYKKDN